MVLHKQILSTSHSAVADHFFSLAKVGVLAFAKELGVAMFSLIPYEQVKVIADLMQNI